MERQETIVDGFGYAAGPWETIFNGTLVAPYNNPYGSWGNLPGGSSVGGYFPGHVRRRITKIGMQWQPIGTTYDGAGRFLQFAHDGGAYTTYAPEGTGLDCADMGLFADGVYREYVLPAELVARGVLWSRGFDEGYLNGYLYKIRIFTDDFTPAAIAQGRTGLVPAGGVDAPYIDSGSGAWLIVRENGDVISYRSYPRGWYVGWDGTKFVVHAPLGAEVHPDFQVRFQE